MWPRPTIPFCHSTCILFLFAYGSDLQAQSSLCPPNIDFKLGDFSHWECRTGSVAANNLQNVATWYSTGEVNGRHQLIAPTSTATDPYGGFPQHCPNSNTYTVKLGNESGGHEAEGLFYTYTIPATNTKFSILYYYAIVLQNPGHQPHEQPRFRARVVDVATETEIDCVSFDFSSSGSLPGFQPSGAGNAVYKDWTPVSVDLSAFAGKTVRLEFITSDCVFQQHFGYAYISIGSNCNGSIAGGYYCEGDTSISVTAPHGYESYNWYADTNFGQPISSLQNIVLDLADVNIGDVLPVIVFPYEGYGCLDTLYVTIETALKPVSRAGPDVISCSKRAVQLGTSPNVDYAYSWTPSQFLSAPFSANPTTLLNIQQPTDFIVKTTHVATGCFSFDTTRVTPIVVDTSSSIAGKSVYCPGEQLQTSLTVRNTTTQVQWFKGNASISGATGFLYRPETAGTYWAELKQFGCVDSTFQYQISYASIPNADFVTNKTVQCLTYPVAFTNTSSIQGNEPMRYLWKFSDGTSATTNNIEKSFSLAGTYTATLIATSGTDCMDSVKKTVSIVTNCTPVLPTAFTPNNDGKNERLTPYLVGAKALKRFTIYNRYGNVVFTTSKEGEGWDGKFNGASLQTAVFVWVLEYIGYNGQAVVEKGHVTLIR